MVVKAWLILGNAPFSLLQRASALLDDALSNGCSVLKHSNQKDFHQGSTGRRIQWCQADKAEAWRKFILRPHLGVGAATTVDLQEGANTPILVLSQNEDPNTRGGNALDINSGSQVGRVEHIKNMTTDKRLRGVLQEGADRL